MPASLRNLLRRREMSQSEELPHAPQRAQIPRRDRLAAVSPKSGVGFNWSGGCMELGETSLFLEPRWPGSQMPTKPAIGIVQVEGSGVAATPTVKP